MDFNIISTSEGSAVIENDSGLYLAINSGLKNKAFVGTDTSRLQSLPGLIIDNGEISNWKLEGVTEIDGIIYYYGPYMEGKTLPEIDMTPAVLLKLTSALQTIKERNFPVRQFSLNSVFMSIDDKILFFPPRLMEFLNSHRPRKNSLNMIDPWNNVKLSGEQARSFTIASLAYRTITGEYPFPGESEEEIQNLISNQNYKSPLLSEPSLKKEIYQLIESSFNGEGTLIQWQEVLKNWMTESLTDKSLNSEQKDKILETEIKKENRRAHKWKFRNYLQKNRVKLISSLVVIVILGAILQAPLSKYFRPPVTIGMSQIEVIELYYSCFKTLDTEILGDCITSKAGKSDMNQISTIYVTTRVRTSYEGTSGLIDPEQWILDGSNPVEPDVQIWGLTDLKIQRLSENVFEARYTKWEPAQVDDMEDKSLRMPVGIQIRDILHMSLIDDAWKIDQLERTFDP